MELIIAYIIIFCRNNQAKRSVQKYNLIYTSIFFSILNSVFQ
jgi:hypothetical protein